jgi:hypothetical protein
MPRLTKKISEIVTLPLKWQSTWNPTVFDEETGREKPIYKELPEYELGPGKVKIFSLSKEELSRIQTRCVKQMVVEGKLYPMLDTKMVQETEFVERLGGTSGWWENFLGPGPDGKEVELNCTTENQRRFAYDDGLRTFVCHHVGPILDKIADGKASEEEKNLLNSLLGQPVGGKESTTMGVGGARK